MEIQLAQKLGVSRTPVREAIRKLELEGLVLMIPRKGAEVAEITIKDLEDVLEVRAALEELAVCDACENITEEQILALKEAADNFQAALESDDLVKCAETDMAFHEIIYSATNNKRLLQILNNLREQMYRYQRRAVRSVFISKTRDVRSSAAFEMREESQNRYKKRKLVNNRKE